MPFKPGDHVQLLDEKAEGVILSVQGSHALIRLREGLEFLYPLAKLVSCESWFTDSPKQTDASKKQQKQRDQASQLWEHTYFPKVKSNRVILKDKDEPERPKQLNKQLQTDDAWEIDLHIQELVPRYKHLTNAEIIQIQLEHLREFLERARSRKVKRAIIIHGVGKGKLREEVHHVLMGYVKIDFFDAPWSRYGQGATEVRFFYQ